MPQFDKTNYITKFDHEIRWSTQEIATLKRLVKTSLPLVEVAQVVNHKPFEVIMRVRSMGVWEKKNSSGLPEKYKDQSLTKKDLYSRWMQPWEDDDKVKLLMLYQSGSNIFDIAEELQRSPSSILQKIQEFYRDRYNFFYDTAKRYVGVKKRAPRKSGRIVDDGAAKMITGLENLEQFLEEDDEWKFHDSHIRSIKWDDEEKTLDVVVEPIGFSAYVEGEEKGTFLLDFHFKDVVSVNLDWNDYGFIYEIEMKIENGFLKCCFDSYPLVVWCASLEIDRPRLIGSK